MRVLESSLYAEDLVAAHEFYVGVLGLEVISFDPTRQLFLRCGQGVLLIFKASKTRIPDADVPPHGCVGAGHLAFAASLGEIEAWEVRLAAEGVEVTKRIEWRDGVRSIYFEDPAGNVLEFATPSLWGV